MVKSHNSGNGLRIDVDFDLWHCEKNPKTDDDDGRRKMLRNVFAEWLTSEKRLSLFPAWTTDRYSHHRESPTCHEQDLIMLKT